LTFGILQRYVMAEVVRAFVLALLTMTIIFVLFMVMAEAAKLGLSPRDIMKPGSLCHPRHPAVYRAGIDAVRGLGRFRPARVR